MRIFTLFIVLFFTACETPAVLKEQTAMRFSAPAHMVPRTVDAGPFTLQTFERMHNRHTFGHIYIGDVAHNIESTNQTPENPVALHMAAHDNAANIAYIAHPCQFAGEHNKTCENTTQYMNTAALSPTVIEAYQKAIDNIIYTYDLRGVHLIGHGVGGGVAAILAAKRNDVLSLRTVAAVLDHDVYTQITGTAPWDASLNPANFFTDLRTIPQWHFVGAQDDIVPPTVLQHYLQAIDPTQCASYNMIQENEHNLGWVEKWPELLKRIPDCEIPLVAAPAPRLSFPKSRAPEPFYQPRVLDLGKGWK